MSNAPTLEEVVQAVDALALRKRRRALQGRPATYPDGAIVALALAVYQKLAGFRYAKQMLAVLGSLGVAVPSAATFGERKTALLG